MSETAMLRRETTDTQESRVEVDEEGMLRVLAASAPVKTAERGVGSKIRYLVGLSAPDCTRAAWKLDPTCAHCAERVDDPAKAALVIGGDRARRIAHRGECFILAIIASNPAIVAGKSKHQL